MNEVIRNIYKSVSVRLSVSILTFVVVIFAVTMTILIHRSKASVRQAAIEESGQMLTNTAQRLTGIMDEVEVATLNTYWQVFQQLQPDSLLALSARILELNPMLNGCSIAMEPNFFPSEGRYFSAYSFNNDGYIDTENEGSDDYPYFNMDWYQEPLKKGKACWVDPFQDYNPSGIYSRDVIASFCKPLVTKNGRTIGVISVDLSQRMLSKILTREWRYPDSYFILVGAKNTIIATSKVDAKMADLKRRDCLVLEQPLSDSGWRLALVCPEEDIFRGYNKMIIIIVSVMVFGLLFMFAICYYIVRRTMEPVIKLTKQTTDIAEGHFDSQIAPSTRIDEVGKLQNSFHTMQQSIASHVAELETARSETERKNKELTVAKTLAEESDRKKTAFVQDMVVRRQEDVESYVGKILGKLVRTRKGGIAHIRFSRQGKLHIRYGQVRFRDPVFDISEKRRISVFLSTFGYSAMAQDITDDKDGHRVGPGRQQIEFQGPEGFEDRSAGGHAFRQPLGGGRPSQSQHEGSCQ